MSYQIRSHQNDAINSIIESLDIGKKNILVQMAVGSGITITCFAALKELINIYSWKSVVILSDRRVLVDQLKHVKNDFWEEDFSNTCLDVKTTKSFIKQNVYPEIIVLFNLHSFDKLLSKYLVDFSGIILNFSTQNLIESDGTNHLFNSELIFKYTIQDAISRIPEHFSHEPINTISEGLKSILEEISSIKNKFGTNQLQNIARAHRDVTQSLEQLNYDYSENKKLISEVVKHKLSISDVKEIGYRKEQLHIFDLLLNNDVFFNNEKEKLNGGIELVWQTFFERNKWILGIGLNQIFHSSLSDKKLEQTVAGFDLNSSGKRVDALMKSKGLIENLCFIELKTHASQLMNDKPYRKECFSPTHEMSGAIAQIQKTVAKAEKIIKGKLEINDDYGNPTGEVLFNYKPKSYLIIGSLKEFETKNGINNQKYASFELLRKSINNLEIITFDELYEKAKFISMDN